MADISIVNDVIEQDIKPRLGLQTQYASSLVHVMRSVATRWVKGISKKEIDIFSGVKAELSNEYCPGVMSSKDRERIAPFLTDVNNMATLVSFPTWVIEDAERIRKRGNKISTDMARDVQTSIMCLIEQTLPVRLGDLAKTKIDVNIIFSTSKTGSAMLHYIPGKTNNKGKDAKSLQIALAPHKTRMLEAYIKYYLPVLSNDPTNTYLFPGDKPGTHKTYGAVGRQCKKMVKERTGHTVNMHLWRKLMGGYLLMKTKNMELVEGLLGHVHGSGATSVYAEMQSSWASAELDKHIAKLVTSTGSRRSKAPQSCKWARR